MFNLRENLSAKNIVAGLFFIAIFVVAYVATLNEYDRVTYIVEASIMGMAGLGAWKCFFTDLDYDEKKDCEEDDECDEEPKE